jgi:hypothetical protein
MMFLVVGFTSPTPRPTLKESSYPVKETAGLRLFELGLELAALEQ